LSYRPRTPLYLHSFPTRRSSDLERVGPGEHPLATLSLRGGGDEEGNQQDLARHQLYDSASIASPTSRRSPTRRRSSTQTSIARRSEEHTSELQSQSNLVCRLLLE